jgi:hypothetical protein
MPKPPKTPITLGAIIGTLVVLWIAWKVLKGVFAFVKFGLVIVVLLAIAYFVMQAIQRLKKK